MMLFMEIALIQKSLKIFHDAMVPASPSHSSINVRILELFLEDKLGTLLRKTLRDMYRMISMFNNFRNMMEINF